MLLSFLEAQFLYNCIDATDTLPHLLTTPRLALSIIRGLWIDLDVLNVFCHPEFDIEVICDGWRSENGLYRLGLLFLCDFREFLAELHWFCGLCFCGVFSSILCGHTVI